MVGDLQLNVVSFWHLMGDVYFHGRAVGMKDLILGQSFFFCRVKGRMTLDGKTRYVKRMGFRSGLLDYFCHLL